MKLPYRKRKAPRRKFFSVHRTKSWKNGGNLNVKHVNNVPIFSDMRSGSSRKRTILTEKYRISTDVSPISTIDWTKWRTGKKS